MQNIILFFLLFITFLPSKSISRKYSILYYTISTLDSIPVIDSNKYYMVDITNQKEGLSRISRRLNNDSAIVKGSQLNFVNVNQNLTLLNNTWKISSSLSRDNPLPTQIQLFSIKIAQGTHWKTVLDDLEIKVIKHFANTNILLVETTYEIIKKVIQNSAIEYVDKANRVASEESPLRQYNPSINRISTAKNRYPHLKGSLVVSLKENSIIENDIDLLGKVTLDTNSSTEFTQHAKEMGTLIGGSGNSHKTGEGVALGASLICTNFSSLFAENATYYNGHFIKVQNHSYGTGIENFYGNESVSYDQITNDIPELVHVFSAGNAGSLAPEFGTYSGISSYANLTGDFKQSKNVLVIAALDSSMNHVGLTSSGPAYDGRLKPELAAFGGEGTSESAAIVSGAVVMLQNHFTNLNGYMPTSSLIKSLLIAGANEADTPGIDFRTGYGSVNLNKSLQIIDANNYIEASLESNTTYSFNLNVPANTSELKVVVSWIDPPANPEDAFALVNDLDLSITSPLNTIWLPWVLDSSPNTIALSSAPTRGKDHLNNVEMVSIKNPETGAFTVNISAAQLATNIQNFSVAFIVEPTNSFEWSFPTTTDYLEAGTTPYFRWENTYASQSGNLFIKYGNGAWFPIGQPLVTSEQFKYTLKDTTIYATLKMAISGIDYISDTFSISKPMRLSVENDCDSDFILSWNKLANTTSYVLYELQTNQLKPILTTADTLVTLDKSTYSGNFYAVQPIQANGLKSLQSFTIDVINRNQGCFLTNFLVFLDPDGFANIQMDVNVPYEINEITILKTFHSTENVLEQFSPGSETHFSIEDNDLTPGNYQYSTQLLLNNGATIFSDTLTLFYTDDKTVIVYPNPVQADFVNILNAFPGGKLQLINQQGQTIKYYDLVNMVEPIDLVGISKGVYVFRILFEEKIVSSGKIIRL